MAISDVPGRTRYLALASVALLGAAVVLALLLLPEAKPEPITLGRSPWPTEVWLTGIPGTPHLAPGGDWLDDVIAEPIGDQGGIVRLSLKAPIVDVTDEGRSWTKRARLFHSTGVRKDSEQHVWVQYQRGD